MATTTSRPSKTRASTAPATGSGKPPGTAAKAARGAAKPSAPAGEETATTVATAAAKPAGDTVEGAADTLGELKKRELVELVVARSGIRKKFVKPAVEAMLDILGEAIAEGRELNLQPFGKITRKRARDTANARVTTAQIRQSKSAGPALGPGVEADAGKPKETVADAAE